MGETQINQHPDPAGAAAAALDRLKIFPLPGAVLLPGSAVPLHIFEPRYRLMLEDCRAGDQVLALASLVTEGGVGDAPRVNATVGVGVLAADQLLPDGRSVILLQGVLRARIEEELWTATPYRQVRARLLEERDRPDDLAEQAALLRHMVQRLARTFPDGDLEPLVKLTHGGLGPGRMADAVGGLVLDDPGRRQELLEELIPARRLEMVNQRLVEVLGRMTDGGDGPTLN